MLYAFTSGKPGVANGIDVIFKDIAIRGFWLKSPRFRSSPKLLEAMKLGARLVAEGKLRVPIAATYPLAAAAAALTHAQKGGKVLFALV